MFVATLRFSVNKSLAPQYMEDHNAWIERGFDDGIFLLTGTLQPKAGGMILAHNTTHAELQARLQEDPFVAQNIVSAEILEVAPGCTDERLSFLVG